MSSWVLQEGKQKPCFQERVEPISQLPSSAQAMQKLGFSFLLLITKRAIESQRIYTINGADKRLPQTHLCPQFPIRLHNNFLLELDAMGVN
jgi:hypothetical protein